MLASVTMEAVLDRANLQAAYLAVKANRGAPGVDGMEVEELRAHWERHGDVLLGKLLGGTYRPAAVRGVAIPKPKGGQRLLGIPTVLDRMIQQALLQALGPVFDPGFSDSSYGFRPKRSAHDAVRAAQGYVAAGKPSVVDIDLKNFFDQVDHDRVMAFVARKVRDQRVLRLIGEYLRAPRQEPAGHRVARQAGTPQGGPLSPLLANIYLDPLDQELARRGVCFVRYADDIAIFAASPRAAERILQSVIEWLEKELGLETNRAKSGTGPSEQGSLLGFRLYADGRVGVSPKTVERLKEQVRACWDGQQSKTSGALRAPMAALRGRLVELLPAGRLAAGSYRPQRLDTPAHAQVLLVALASPKRALRRPAAAGGAGAQVRARESALGAWALANHVIVKQALKTATLNHYGFHLPWERETAPR